MDDPNGPTRVMPAVKPAVPLQPPSAPDDYRLQEVRRAVGSDYDVLGEIGEVGEGAKSGVAYLAQRRESMRLDALRLVLAADYVEVIGKIGLAVPGGSDQCPKCGSQLRAGVRFCGNCRTSLTAARLNDATQSLNIAEWLEVKSEAARHSYEVLGQITKKQNRPVADEQGTAIVFIARTTNTSRIVALRFERGPTGSPGVLGLDQAGILPELVASLFDEPAKPVAAPVAASVAPQPEGSPLPTPPTPVAPLAPLPPAPMSRPGRPIWAMLLGGAAVIAAIAWLSSAVFSKNAARNDRAAAEKARVDSLRRDSIRADSVRLAAIVDSATVRISAGLPTGASISVDDAPVSSQIVHLAPGSHTFAASARGYKPARQTLNVLPGQSLTWPRRLEPEARAPDTTSRVAVSDCADAARRSDWARALGACSKEAGSSKGNAFAERTLGMMHERGLGVAQNYPVAAEWYSAAASHGNADAQFSLGMLYASGQGVGKSDAEATKWLQQAAAQGNERAKQELARRGARP
jgi:hypothetical protein